MEVDVGVSEPDGASLEEGLQATIRLDAYPALVFKGHFDAASPVATALLDSTVKTFPARFRLDEQDPHLLPDLSAAVDVEVIAKAPAVLAPRSAVHFREGKPYVTRLAAPNSEEERAVILGESDDTWIEITSGLEPGDEIPSPDSPPGAARSTPEKRS
jgi:hypothetical protein